MFRAPIYVVVRVGSLHIALWMFQVSLWYLRIENFKSLKNEASRALERIKLTDKVISTRLLQRSAQTLASKAQVVAFRSTRSLDFEKDETFEKWRPVAVHLKDQRVSLCSTGISRRWSSVPAAKSTRSIHIAILVEHS